MTVKEAINEAKGQYTQVEVHRYSCPGNSSIRWLPDEMEEVDLEICEDETILHYEVMTPKEYEQNILSNCDLRADELFDEDDQILCILLPFKNKEN